MRREEIAAQLAQYECSHEVTAYEAYGVDAWPLLRVTAGAVALSASVRARTSVAGAQAGSPWRRASLIGRFTRGLLTSAVVEQVQRLHVPGPWHRWSLTPTPGPREVVILSAANNLLPMGDAEYNPLTDPMVELLRARDCRFVVWEHGSRRGRRVVEPVPISERLARETWLEQRLRPLPTISDAPAWFHEWDAWCRQTIGRPAQWPDTSRYLRDVALMSRVLQRWFQSVSCRLIVMICWYSRLHMAALLAASRLGIRSVDLQHGLQGDGHFAYAGWAPGPPEGYATAPDAFWVWGEADAEVLRRSPGLTGGQRQVLVGGNNWLNQWRSSPPRRLEAEIRQTRALTAGHDRVVLVTLQEAAPFEPMLLPLIEQSPRTWQWLIRLRHTMAADRSAITERLRQTGHPGINVDDATDMPLYALMSHAHVHVTWFSTCAVEAMAFGVPTLLLHPSGEQAFADFVSRGLMVVLSDSGDGRAAFEACDRIAAEDLRRGCDRVFASPASAQRALDQLFC